MNSSIRTDAVDKTVLHSDAEEIFIQSLVCGSLGWMFGFVDGGGDRYDSALSSIEEARQDARQDIENAWRRTPQPRTDKTVTSEAVHVDARTDTYEGLSAIERARREAIADIEGAHKKR